jgi:hypothetical protein
MLFYSVNELQVEAIVTVVSEFETFGLRVFTHEREAGA